MNRARRSALGPVLRVAACGALLAAQLAGAAPAPWYWWQSKVDGTRICAQVSPGPGWERASAAYAGPGCAPKPRVFVVPVR
jgi:hypothetical protein